MVGRGLGSGAHVRVECCQCGLNAIRCILTAVVSMGADAVAVCGVCFAIWQCIAVCKSVAGHQAAWLCQARAQCIANQTMHVPWRCGLCHVAVGVHTSYVLRLYPLQARYHSTSVGCPRCQEQCCIPCLCLPLLSVAVLPAQSLMIKTQPQLRVTFSNPCYRRPASFVQCSGLVCDAVGVTRLSFHSTHPGAADPP